MGKYRYIDLGPDEEWDDIRVKLWISNPVHWITDKDGWTFNLSHVVGYKLIKDSEWVT